jgi:hypothetical protein
MGISMGRASMFWPGSEAEIGGYRPTYYHDYDSGFAYDARVQQVCLQQQHATCRRRYCASVL